MAVKEEAQFYDGDLPLPLTGLGKVNAAAALTHVLTRDRRSSHVISLGTAGAVRPGWTGTHVVGTVIQHDRDGDLLREITGESWGSRWHSWIATGDVFVSDPVVRERPAARAALVDMEAYALDAAAHQAGVPIRVAKRVSDGATEGAGQTWRETLAESACARRLGCKKHSVIELAAPAPARTVRCRLDKVAGRGDELLENAHQLERARELAVRSAFPQPDRTAQTVVLCSGYEHQQRYCHRIHRWVRQLAYEHLTQVACAPWGGPEANP